jgi:hypothetical protein
MLVKDGEPIGDYDWTDPSKSFRGNYDGDGYEIRNMYINNRDGLFVGVFGSSDGVYFQNMNVMNFDITSGTHVGGIVGISYSDSISNCIAQGIIDASGFLGLLIGAYEGYKIKDCHVQGEINNSLGGARIGGLIGDCSADSIKNCSADVSIFSEGMIVGGLFGNFVNWSNTGSITECYAYCNINSTREYVGGIFGAIVDCPSNPMEIVNCFSQGVINSIEDRVGGFIGGVGLNEGWDEYLTISDCFTTVDVVGKDKVGGFAGDDLEITNIINCYSSGSVTGNSNVGGFIGLIDSLNTVSVTNSYWDTDTSGLLTTAGNLGEGRTTVEMTDPHAGNTYVGWDFTNIWVEDVDFHNNGYPFLGWHDTSIDNNYELLTMNYELEQNYPNPFNNQTNIGYTLEDMGKVEISVYNGNGQFVSEVVNRVVNAGMHSATFNADKLNSGIYYYQLKIDGMVKETKKMLYLR